jgi:serine/threonine protein kinase
VPFLVVDYIEGGSLSQMIRQRFAQHRTGLPSTVFKTLVENTLRALASAHNENVLHLDIKPANIIYSATDDAFVLIDFGLATLSHRDTLNTFIGGTSGYISPEEYINETSRMSDIYSLGITFYEAAVGFNPIARALAEYSIQHGDASQDSTRPGQAVTETTTIDFSILSADKRALIEPMLNHNPKKRPSLERLISLADELQVGVASENLDPLDPSKHLAKETVLEEILRVSKDKPLNSLKITVDDSENVQVWLKTKIVEGALALICVKPKNYLGLANLGWKPYQTGTLVLEFDVQPSYETVAKHIEEAITRGYGITRPFTLT